MGLALGKYVLVFVNVGVGRARRTCPRRYSIWNVDFAGAAQFVAVSNAIVRVRIRLVGTNNARNTRPKFFVFGPHEFVAWAARWLGLAFGQIVIVFVLIGVGWAKIARGALSARHGANVRKVE